MSLPALRGAWTSRLIMIADATSQLTYSESILMAIKGAWYMEFYQTAVLLCSSFCLSVSKSARVVALSRARVGMASGHSTATTLAITLRSMLIPIASG